MINANLDNIKSFLEKLNYNSVIIPKSNEFPIDQLLVKLNQDYRNREQFLLIRTVEQDLCKNDALLDIQSPTQKYQELQLVVNLPFFALETQIPDTARLILLLNKGMEISGFELSEVDKMIFYRHAFVVAEDQLDERIIVSLVGMIEMLLETFSEILEIVASGTQSLQDVVEEAKKMIEMKNNSSLT